MPTGPAPKERPLNGSERTVLVVTVAAVLLGAYVVVALSILFLTALLAGDLVVFLALARFGMGRLITGTIRRHTTLLLSFLQSFKLRFDKKFRLPLSVEEAPRLFALVGQYSQALQVAPPKLIFVEMTAGAWVELRGLIKGKGTTHLGLGYDLLTGLNESEIGAVVAHELAHAKRVNRGFKRLLGEGVGRLTHLRARLSAQVLPFRAQGETFQLGESFVTCFDGLAKAAVRAVAKYSRQDEFEADAGAVALAGAAPMASALSRLPALGRAVAELSWTERLARLEKGEGFAHWLEEKLRLDESADNDDEGHNPYSTHPTITDRIAALPAHEAPARQPGSAISFLRDPDVTAQRLIEEIRRVLAQLEAADTKELNKAARLNARRVRMRFGQLIAFVVGVFAVAVPLGICLAGNDSILPSLTIGAAVLTLSIIAYSKLGYKDKCELVFPPFEGLVKARGNRPAGEAAQAVEKAMEEKIDADLSALNSKGEKKAYLLGEFRAASAVPDYLRLHVISRRMIVMKEIVVEGHVGYAVASAAYGQTDMTWRCLNYLAEKTGLKTPATALAAAWSLYLIGDYAGGETYFSRVPGASNQASVAGMLATCQYLRNKIHTAAQNIERASTMAPDDLELRHLRARIWIAAGRLKEARQLLDTLPRANREIELVLTDLRLALLEENETEAEAARVRLASEGTEASWRLKAAQVLHGNRRRDQAEALYQSVIAVDFVPEALLGLAQLRLEAKAFEEAREFLKSAFRISPVKKGDVKTSLELFPTLLQTLWQTYPREEQLDAWLAHFSASERTGALERHTLLVFGRDQEDCAAYLKFVSDALYPDKPSLVPSEVSWALPPKDQIPSGKAHPGVQQIWSVRKSYVRL